MREGSLQFTCFLARHLPCRLGYKSDLWQRTVSRTFPGAFLPEVGAAVEVYWNQDFVWCGHCDHGSRARLQSAVHLTWPEIQAHVILRLLMME